MPPELVGLLRSIRKHRSLIDAIREVGISYRHAWGLLGRWEAITGHKLAILTRGQGTGLTPTGAWFAEIDEWLKTRVGRRFDGVPSSGRASNPVSAAGVAGSCHVAGPVRAYAVRIIHAST